MTVHAHSMTCSFQALLNLSLHVPGLLSLIQLFAFCLFLVCVIFPFIPLFFVGFGSLLPSPGGVLVIQVDVSDVLHFGHWFSELCFGEDFAGLVLDSF